MTLEEAKTPSDTTTITLESLGKEYTQYCAQLGEFEYKIKMYTLESTNLVEKIKDVNQRAAKVRDEAKMTMADAPTQEGKH